MQVRNIHSSVLISIWVGFNLKCFVVVLLHGHISSLSTFVYLLLYSLIS